MTPRHEDENSGQTPKARVKKEDWILAALEAMRGGGIEAIRVERLAKDLDVSKSGFYYHFEDRDDLLAELLRFWDESSTNAVLTDLELLQMPPRERLIRLSERLIVEDLARYDAAIFAWATIDSRARLAVAKVMQTRSDYIRNILRECGLRGDQLEGHTNAFVGFRCSEPFIFGHLSVKERMERHARLIDTILADADE